MLHSLYNDSKNSLKENYISLYFWFNTNYAPLSDILWTCMMCENLKLSKLV
ncbi:hypothetical protein CWI36_0063p0010 [Hamiltosporidium magnivora]|uniref:Uncharacterized protein n=1 Tax=Hamiltosporidium magnivora TaxID=148818 RepID=A0A4Q9LNK0_9MICR|nr:hypothetical protein CWI36_0063p0010 [Hamiltosporidium magnivora]